MEYVSNLCSPCPLHEQPKGEFIFLGSISAQYVSNSFSVRRKHFAEKIIMHVLSLYNNEYL